MEPHQPAELQQFPKVLPRQVYLFVPPQVASVVTLPVDEGVAAFVEVAEPHVPKADWQPVPQYAEVEPHQPAELQQLPNVLPRQVYPFVPPHVASVVTFLVPVETGAEEVAVVPAFFKSGVRWC